MAACFPSRFVSSHKEKGNIHLDQLNSSGRVVLSSDIRVEFKLHDEHYFLVKAAVGRNCSHRHCRVHS